MFHSVAFGFREPHRKTLCRLYDVSTVVLIGTEFPDVAYAELNDPRQLVPLTEVLSRFSPSQLNRFIDLKNRSFLCEGVRYHSPYHDLFLRSWTISAKLFNNLLRYQLPICLEELQRQIQRLSRSFHVALDGLLGCEFKWQVNFIQPISKGIHDSVPTCREAFSGLNSLPIFPPAQPQYTAASAYAFMAMLVLEVRFQRLEKRVQEFLTLKDGDERIVGVGLEIEQMRQAISAAPSTALVFDVSNPLRHHIDGFDMFIAERYDLKETTSHLSILGLLALCKASSSLKLHRDDIPDLIRPMVSVLTSNLCDQTALTFVYSAGKMEYAPPVVQRQEPVFVSSSCLDYEGEEESQWEMEDVLIEMRASLLRRSGQNVNWSQVQLEPLPEERHEKCIVELAGVDLEGHRGHSDSFSVAKAVARFCCFHY